jgi:hypothetical protein
MRGVLAAVVSLMVIVAPIVLAGSCGGGNRCSEHCGVAQDVCSWSEDGYDICYAECSDSTEDAQKSFKACVDRAAGSCSVIEQCCTTTPMFYDGSWITCLESNGH